MRDHLILESYQELKEINKKFNKEVFVPFLREKGFQKVPTSGSTFYKEYRKDYYLIINKRIFKAATAGKGGQDSSRGYIITHANEYDEAKVEYNFYLFKKDSFKGGQVRGRLPSNYMHYNYVQKYISAKSLGTQEMDNQVKALEDKIKKVYSNFTDHADTKISKIEFKDKFTQSSEVDVPEILNQDPRSIELLKESREAYEKLFDRLLIEQLDSISKFQRSREDDVQEYLKSLRDAIKQYFAALGIKGISINVESGVSPYEYGNTDWTRLSFKEFKNKAIRIRILDYNLFIFFDMSERIYDHQIKKMIEKSNVDDLTPEQKNSLYILSYLKSDGGVSTAKLRMGISSPSFKIVPVGKEPHENIGDSPSGNTIKEILDNTLSTIEAIYRKDDKSFNILQVLDNEDIGDTLDGLDIF